jgi:hypothetical protein
VSAASGLQLDLLRAAFAPPAQALPAWARWQSGSGWEQHVDFDAYLLLPRVYHNLGGRGVDDALFQRLKGVVKRNWAANAATLTAISRIAVALERAAIPCVLLPPCSLLLHDRTVALAAGTPIACQIARRDAQRAVRLLRGQGWRGIARGIPRWSVPGFIAASSRLHLRDGQGRLLDLQWPDTATCAHGSMVHTVHGHALRSPGLRASIQLLLCDAGADSELCRVSRALLLLAKMPDSDGWHCLLAHLRLRCSPLLELVAALAPPGARSGAADRDERADVTVPAASAANSGHSSTFLRRLARPWQHYRSALGAQFSTAQALCFLPGYLMGKWQLQHVGQILPRAYRALRYHWRQP